MNSLLDPYIILLTGSSSSKSLVKGAGGELGGKDDALETGRS